MSDFDPSDWDEAPEYAGYRHWRTGAMMAWEVFRELEQGCSAEQLEKARKVRDAAQMRACFDVTAQHLLRIGKAAGFEDNGKAFAWRSLVDHVLRKLEAAK